MPETDSILISDPALAALDSHLTRDYDARTRQRGQSYAISGRVFDLWTDDEILTASVQGSDLEPYSTSLVYENRTWYGECTCPVSENCKHAHALGLVWLDSSFKRGANPTASKAKKAAGKKSKKTFRAQWEPVLAEKIGRGLTDEEARLLGQLSALFTELRQHGVLTRYALIQHGFAARSTPPDHNYWQPAYPGWWTADTAPKDPWQLWQYIALDWERAGKPIPKAFSPMTDTSAVRGRIDALLLREELDQWRRSLAIQRSTLEPSDAPRGLADTYSDLRVTLQADGQAVLEGQPVNGKPWRTPTQAWLRRLATAKAAELVAGMQQADLGEFDLLVLMIDAVVLAKGVVATVALGIDTHGHKRILGYRVGGSENREVCADLLSNLGARGLTVPASRVLLAVLDGSDALRSALLAHYPSAQVQRCLVHKERNLRGYLSKRHWAELARLFSQLRKVQGSEQAEAAATAIRTFLKDKNAQARESFEEAGGDLLRLFHLEVPNTLHRTLLSTNSIENVFKNLRRHLGRVCRWRENTGQADRWMASGLELAQRGFRRISGHEDLVQLAAALRPQEAKAA